MLTRVHEWLADLGWVQYPIPRRRFGQSRPQNHTAARMLFGALGLFWTLVFGVVLAAMTYVFGVFALVAIGVL